MTGGIGSGKSTVVDAFAQCGAAVFSADDAVHRLYRDPDVLHAVRERWGDAVMSADGADVDRSQIAAIVFKDAREREWIEHLLHPLVAREWMRFVAEHSERQPPVPAIVGEVPLLFEHNLEDRYDAAVLVTAPLAIRMQRVGERGTGAELAEQRAAVQLSDAERVSRATIVIENSGTREELYAAARAAFATLIGVGVHD